MRLRWKILLYTSTLLVLLLAAMLAIVNWQAQGVVGDRITADLEKGRQRIQLVVSERLAGLRLTAQLVTSLPNLKKLFETTDLLTIRDVLMSYQRENRRTDLLIVLNSRGRVVARTDVETADPIPNAERWLETALNERAATGILATERGVYHVAVVPASVAGTVFAFVLAGASIDDAFAGRLQEFGQDEVVILGERTLGSTLPAARVPWRNRTDWEKTAGSASGVRTVHSAGESYAALPVNLAPGDVGAVAVVLRSRDLALAPYRRIQFAFVLVGLGIAAVGILASAVLAGTMTASVGQLVEGTKQVAAGNFDSPLDIRSGDEIGDLALAFNSMMRGLRERADMQKFVSEATVKMIQAQARGIASSGERRQLTLFFSDMRGFTTFAENRSPEEVVNILNTCLSQQAKKVKRFHGDVDKFVGDCVVALFFGEDSALNAIRCGIEIHKALDADNAARPDDQQVEVGIGIVTGEVILGSIGSEDRRDFTAVGSNVNLCARLCSMAGPQEILISESSYQVVQDLVAAEKLEPVQLKGFSEPVPVYRIRARASV